MNEPKRTHNVPQHLEAVTLKLAMAVAAHVAVPLSARVARLVEDTLRDLANARNRHW